MHAVLSISMTICLCSSKNFTVQCCLMKILSLTIDIKYWLDRWKQSFRIWDMFGEDEKVIYWLSKKGVPQPIIIIVIIHTILCTWMCCSALQLVVYNPKSLLMSKWITFREIWHVDFEDPFPSFDNSNHLQPLWEWCHQSHQQMQESGGQTSQQWCASHFMTVLVGITPEYIRQTFSCLPVHQVVVMAVWILTMIPIMVLLTWLLTLRMFMRKMILQVLYRGILKSTKNFLSI